MRPWYSRPPSEDYGSEEIVGPGGLEPVGLTGFNILDRARVAMGLRPLCESPIEVDLGAHLVLLLAGGKRRLAPQYRWRRWRMDFALLQDRKPVLFIECDGREFHSTPQQIASDRAKDRAAKEAGIPLLRFTGSEIYNDPGACARLIIERVR